MPSSTPRSLAPVTAVVWLVITCALALAWSEPAHAAVKESPRIVLRYSTTETDPDRMLRTVFMNKTAVKVRRRTATPSSDWVELSAGTIGWLPSVRDNRLQICTTAHLIFKFTGRDGARNVIAYRGGSNAPWKAGRAVAVAGGGFAQAFTATRCTRGLSAGGPQGYPQFECVCERINRIDAKSKSSLRRLQRPPHLYYWTRGEWYQVSTIQTQWTGVRAL